MIKRRSLINQKRKGDASAIVTFLIVVFFLAVSFIVVGFANEKIKEVVDTTVLNSTSVADDVSTQLGNITEKTINNGFAAIVAFLIIGMMISSMMVKVHPVFLFLYIIVTAIAIFVAMPLANAYEEVIANPTFADVAAHQTMITWIMQHLVLVILGTAALSMIILFSKLGRNSVGGGSDI